MVLLQLISIVLLNSGSPPPHLSQVLERKLKGTTDLRVDVSCYKLPKEFASQIWQRIDKSLSKYENFIKKEVDLKLPLDELMSPVSEDAESFYYCSRSSVARAGKSNILTKAPAALRVYVSYKVIPSNLIVSMMVTGYRRDKPKNSRSSPTETLWPLKEKRFSQEIEVLNFIEEECMRFVADYRKDN